MNKPTYEEIINHAKMNSDCGEHMSPAEIKELVLACEAQVKQLAAENAALKSVIDECKAYFISGIRKTIRPTNEGYLHMRCDTIIDGTPATDAILASLRAEGVEMAAQSDQFSNWVQQGLRHFALCIRDGSAQLRSKSEVQS